VNRAIAGSKAKLDDRLGPELADRLGRMNRNLVIFPNLIINDIMGTTIRVCEPMAPDYMEVTAWEIAPKNEPSLLRAIRHDNFLTFLGPGGFATPDDIEGMESSQRGYAAYLEVPWATYSKGMEVPDGEQAGPWGSDFMMRSYWRHWANTMGIVPVKAPEVAGGPRTKSENAAA
jgi:p-cumate 2,3-dioxygenase alpha subunit